MSSAKDITSELNHEFEVLLSSTSSDLDVTLLKTFIKKLFFLRCIKWLLITLLLYSIVYFIPVVNWNASAVGRLILIKLVLPFYDWQYLYNEHCLLNHMPIHSNDVGTSTATYTEHDYSEFNEDWCSTCENYGKKIIFNELITFLVISLTYVEFPYYHSKSWNTSSNYSRLKLFKTSIFHFQLKLIENQT